MRRGTDRSADEPRLETTQVGNRVEVRARGSRSGRTRGSIDLTVVVPADAAVSVRSVSGDVDLTGVTGDVRLESVSGSIVLAKAGNVALAKTVSGGVTVRDSTTTGTLMISSVSGAVLANGVRASALEASSVSGAIRLSAVAAERVGAKTVSGVVEYGGPLAGGGRYELTSHSGDVVVRLPAGAGFDLAADTFSGRLTSDFPVTLRSSRGGPASRTDSAAWPATVPPSWSFAASAARSPSAASKRRDRGARRRAILGRGARDAHRAHLPARLGPGRRRPGRRASTWRLDVFHTGGRGTEVFAIDGVVVEPLPWPGHPGGRLDDHRLGSTASRCASRAGGCSTRADTPRSSASG